MALLTNKQVRKKNEVLSVLKAYKTRWRIEEMFPVQKQEFQLEDIRVRTLTRLKRMYLLLSILIMFMTIKIEKENGFFHAVIERAKGIKSKDRIKMFLYRFSAGIKAILNKDRHGIQYFKYIERRKNPRQLAFKL